MNPSSDLHELIDQGDLQGVRQFLVAHPGCDLEKRESLCGRTALHQAVWRAALFAEERQHPIMGLLLKARANANAADRYGNLPLITAGGGSDNSIMRGTVGWLLAHGANPHALHPMTGETVIEACECFGNPSLMELLRRPVARGKEAASQGKGAVTFARGRTEQSLVSEDENTEEAGQVTKVLAA